jgi:hypothetical protein
LNAQPAYQSSALCVAVRNARKASARLTAHFRRGRSLTVIVTAHGSRVLTDARTSSISTDPATSGGDENTRSTHARPARLMSPPSMFTG